MSSFHVSSDLDMKTLIFIINKLAKDDSFKQAN